MEDDARSIQFQDRDFIPIVMNTMWQALQRREPLLENTNCRFNRYSQAGQVPVELLLVPAQYSITRSLERRDGEL